MRLHPAVTHLLGGRFNRKHNPMESIGHFPSASVDPETIYGSDSRQWQVDACPETDRFTNQSVCHFRR
jgi:hypothetical protein